MRLTPRKAELEAIVAIQESDQFEDAQSMAKAIIKTAFELILEREWYVHAYQFTSGPPAVFTGPFPSEHEATKYGQSLGLDASVRHFVLKVSSVAERERAIANSENGALAETCKCGHPDFLHKHDKSGGKCAHGNGKKWRGGCQCKTFKKGEAAA